MLTPPSRGMGILLKTRGEGTVDYRKKRAMLDMRDANLLARGRPLVVGTTRPRTGGAGGRTAGPRWPDPQRRLRVYLTAEGWESGVM
jgi:hypothetical protein